MNQKLEQIEDDIKKLKQRNKKVEQNKAWEVSIARKSILSILIYICVLICFLYLDISNPFFNAIIPTTAFILSTMSMTWFKYLWLNKFYKGNI